MMFNPFTVGLATQLIGLNSEGANKKDDKLMGWHQPAVF